MHIPDGFLSTPVWAAAGAVSLPSIALLARQANPQAEHHRIPLMGVMGAFVFAAQMINFPVGAGTSGHIVGAALLAVTLGPAAACIVMTAILAVQALLFQDGGVLALGANVFNMALAGVFAGYLPYHYWDNTPYRRAAIFLGGFLSVFTSACLAMTQLVISGATMPQAILAGSLGLFLISALIEGGITLAVSDAIERLNRQWIRPASPKPANSALGLLLIAALLLASIGALLASALPDGLEKLSEDIGIAGKARAIFQTPLADYEAAFLTNPALRKAAPGVLGLAAVYAVCVVAGRLVSRRALHRS